MQPAGIEGTSALAWDGMGPQLGGSDVSLASQTPLAHDSPGPAKSCCIPTAGEGLHFRTATRWLVWILHNNSYATTDACGWLFVILASSILPATLTRPSPDRLLLSSHDFPRLDSTRGQPNIADRQSPHCSLWLLFPLHRFSYTHSLAHPTSPPCDSLQSVFRYQLATTLAHQPSHSLSGFSSVRFGLIFQDHQSLWSVSVASSIHHRKVSNSIALPIFNESLRPPLAIPQFRRRNHDHLIFDFRRPRLEKVVDGFHSYKRLQNPPRLCGYLQHTRHTQSTIGRFSADASSQGPLQS